MRERPLQALFSVDDAAIEVVENRWSQTAAIQGNEGADIPAVEPGYRQHHPLRAVP